MGRNTPTWLCLTALLFVASACQPASIGGAVSSLNKLEAATQVGVAKSEYRSLLIEAKAKVKTAEKDLDSGSLKRHLSNAISAYQAAATIWDDGFFRRDVVPYGFMESQFSMPVKVEEAKQHYTGYKVSLDCLWKYASSELEQARKN